MVSLQSLVLGLYWEWADAVGAFSAMLAGDVLYTVPTTFYIQSLGFHPIMLSLLLSLLALVVGNRLDHPAPPTPVMATDK